VKKSGL